MSTWIWALVLLAAVWAAQWGAERLAKPLKKLRKQWGFSLAAGGALVGIAVASPELGINITSAVRGVSGIGLGVLLGSNIIAIPIMVLTAFLATRKKNIKGLKGHEEDVKEHRLKVEPQAVKVLALPYLGLVIAVAILTIPKDWRGLQPMDGWIMLGMYVVFIAQALLRGRKEKEKVEWSSKEKWLTAAGLFVLALGAYFTVRATENLISAFGISSVIGGLFITSPMAALPEVFATWSVARSGQVTPSITSIISDHATTMAVAFFPLAMVGVPVENFQLFYINMIFAFLVPALYTAFIHFGGSTKSVHGFQRWQVFTLLAVLLVYVAVVLFGVLQVMGGTSGAGANHFKTFNRDGNDYLEDDEFYRAVDKIGYFENWNQDSNQYLDEDEWRAGISEYLGGYQVRQVEEFGEWDLNGDSRVSEEEFKEGLFEVADKDRNRQISESEFINLYLKGSGSQRAK
jgi:cation:H+ antiporter